MKEIDLPNSEVVEVKKDIPEEIKNPLHLKNKLTIIQQNLKAPKGQFNKFGNYKYRSCEDILEAVKPLLGECVLHLTDEIVVVGERYYVKATASLTDGVKTYTSFGWARESEQKKGMDASQVTGAASSYARKYALNGLLLIDDNKDHDTNELHQQSQGRVAVDKTKLIDKKMMQVLQIALKDQNKEENALITHLQDHFKREIPTIAHMKILEWECTMRLFQKQKK